MTCDFLQFNTDKTEVVIIGHLYNKSQIKLVPNIQQVVKNLGVYFDTT